MPKAWPTPLERIFAIFGLKPVHVAATAQRIARQGTSRWRRRPPHHFVGRRAGSRRVYAGNRKIDRYRCLAHAYVGHRRSRCTAARRRERTPAFTRNQEIAEAAEPLDSNRRQDSRLAVDTAGLTRCRRSLQLYRSNRRSSGRRGRAIRHPESPQRSGGRRRISSFAARATCGASGDPSPRYAGSG